MADTTTTPKVESDAPVVKDETALDPTPATVEKPAAPEVAPTDKAEAEAPAVTKEEDPAAAKPVEPAPVPAKEVQPADTKADESAAAKETEPTLEKAEEPASASAFAQLAAKLPEILKDVGHDEMWGVKLSTASPTTDIPTSIVIQKFLNANDGDLPKAVEQFTAALKFRKEKKPVELLEKTFSDKKFGQLGAVTVYTAKGQTIPDVFTWNLYGNVKDRMDEVFTPLNEFLDYRIALQELGIKQLNLPAATEPITADKDPYKITQVHDYKGVSFFRQNPNVRAASTEVIKQFAVAYPELLKEKYFVNVPAVMGWVYGVIKMFVAEKTRKKFHPMANGANLAAEYKAGPLDETQLPKEYGGQAGSGDGTLKGVSYGVEPLKFE